MWDRVGERQEHTRLTTPVTTWSTWVLPVAASVYLFALNLQVPLFADDYCRKGDIFDPLYAAWAAYRDYLRWTGRLPVMFLNRLFFSGGWAGILVLNLVNSAFVLLLAKLVMLHTRTEGQPWPFAAGFSVFVFLVWFSTDVFGEAVIWKSGQIQYFWACILALACISPVFQFAIWGRDFEPSRRIMVLYLVGCLLGGLWLEHQSVAVCVIWTALLVYMYFVDRREVPRSLWIGLLFWFSGAVILIVAPGNYARAEVLGDRLALIDKIVPISWRFFSQIDNKLLIVYGILVTYGTLVRQDDVGRKFIQSAMFLLLGFLCALVTMGAPNIMYSGRVAFPSEFFLVCSVTSLFPRFISRAESNERISSCIRLQQLPLLLFGALCLLVVTLDARNIYSAYEAINVQQAYRGQLIEAAKLDVVSPVEIPPLHFDRETHTGNGEVNEGRRFARDITHDPGRWENVCFARAYGIDKVRLK